MKSKRLGYVVRAGNESIKQTLNWYDGFFGIPKNKGELDRDIADTVKNIGPRTVQVYRVELVPVGSPIRSKSVCLCEDSNE